MNHYISQHNLDFEIAPWDNIFAKEIAKATHDTTNWMRFRVGTCEGLWTSEDDSYTILAVTNNEPGNGHFDDVLGWFEFSCARDNKLLRIREVMNEFLAVHLVLKRGFKHEQGDDYIKVVKPHDICDKDKVIVISTGNGGAEHAEAAMRKLKESYPDREIVCLNEVQPKLCNPTITKSDPCILHAVNHIDQYINPLTKKQRNEVAQDIRREPKILRNDPCSCGSGKKFKKCCERSKS
jgi:hypothetical protein